VIFSTLWDTRLSNLVTDGDTEEEVLAFVREMVEQYGPEVTQSWTLARDSNADKTAFRIIAVGAALAAYAQETVAAD